MAVEKYFPSIGGPLGEHENIGTVWRYMDFTKFVSMLSTKALFCSSLASFEDPFEGAAGLLENKESFRAENVAIMKDSFIEHGLNGFPETRKSLIEYWQEIAPHLSQDDWVDMIANQEFDTWEDITLVDRKATWVNCWYESEYESLAMWKLYSKDNQNAIAIKSSVRSIEDSLRGGRFPVSIKRVRYINYSCPPRNFNGMRKCWFKSYHFEHEKEVRLLPTVDSRKIDYRNIPSAIMLPVKLNHLIEEVFISPWAGVWLLDLVKEITAMYGLDVKVTQSEIAKKPLYI